MMRAGLGSSRVELFEAIRRDARREDVGVRELARRYGVHRRTVRQALASAVPPPRQTPTRVAPRLDPVKPLIDAMLREDLTAPRKQRHTARRVLARLVEEHGHFDMKYPTVRDYVARRRAGIAPEAGTPLVEAMVPQSHEPGAEAEVDFAELYIDVGPDAVRTKVFLFRLRLSFSGARYAQSPPAEDGPWRRNLLVCALGSFTTITGMTLILPILPLYVRQLGVSSPAQVTSWAGIAYSVTFLAAALTAPLWGFVGDRYGRKLLLVRASLGMALATTLIGFAQNVPQLVFLRLGAGLFGGFASGSMILVADQAPRRKSAWALGVLSSAIMAGNVLGPMLGGTLAQAVSVRAAFIATGALIFLAFLGTAFFLHEHHRRTPKASTAPDGQTTTAAPSSPPRSGGWRAVPHKSLVLCLLGLSTILMFATLSVEPIITVHVEHLTGSTHDVAVYAAVVFSLTALGTVLSGPPLGKIADRVGNLPVLAVSLTATTILLALQAFAPELWSFAALRFLTGLALGGITPAVVASLRRLLPSTTVGLVLGYNVSAQYLGQVAGPVVAGWLGGHLGTYIVFIMTAAVTALGLLATLAIRPRHARITTEEVVKTHNLVDIS